MEIRNLAAMALLNIYEKKNISTSELVRGTGLKLENLKQTSQSHHWNQFVKMYQNCSDDFGPEQTIRLIGESGINNSEMSAVIKIATGFFDVKSIYWGLSIFASKHLFKDCVKFKYHKISSYKIEMDISIREDLQDCPLLIETYIYIFENIPMILGLQKAKVSAEISERTGKFKIYFAHTSYLRRIFNRIKHFAQGYNSTLEIMGQIENQSAELSKLVEEKSQLIRILSHDVANQVTIIDYYTNKAYKNTNISDENKTALEISINGINNLRSILYNIQNMEISNVKGLILGPVDIKDLFESVANNYRFVHAEKGIILKFENNIYSHHCVLADKVSLEINIIGNLINNAIKFSPANSQITIKADEYQDKILISVIDQGIGIDLNLQTTLFSDKIRKSSKGTHGEDGTGFGLGIVKNYVRLMRGDISVHSNFPTGTIFTIELESALPKILDINLAKNDLNLDSNLRN